MRRTEKAKAESSMSIDEKIHEATIKVLMLTTGMKGIDNFDAMEIYLRALLSVAMDAADGDHEKAAEWIDKWLLPNVINIRDEMKKGGTSVPVVVDGQRLN
jgi:hypothetical protein